MLKLCKTIFLCFGCPRAQIVKTKKKIKKCLKLLEFPPSCRQCGDKNLSGGGVDILPHINTKLMKLTVAGASNFVIIYIKPNNKVQVQVFLQSHAKYSF